MDDEQRLVIALEARISKYERDLKKAHATTDQQFRQMERRAETAAEKMQKAMAGAVAGIGRSIGPGLIAAIGVGSLTEAVRKVGEVAHSIAEIGDQAKRAGLSARAFQELAFVARQNRIEVDALTDGMKELSLRADEFITTGQGSGAASFRRLGYSAEELKKKLKDPSALLSDIIGKVQHLDRAAQIRIFDELFGGTGGEQFVQLIEQGRQGIEDTVDEAHRLGIVMDDELIAKADEVNRKFNTLATIVGVHVKGAIIDAAGALDTFITKFNKVQQHIKQANGDDFISQRNGWLAYLGILPEKSATPQGRIAGAFANADENQNNGKLTPEELRKHFGRAPTTITVTAPAPTPAYVATPTARPNIELEGMPWVHKASGGGGSSQNAYARVAQHIAEQTRSTLALTAAQAKINPLVDDFGRAMAKASAEQDLLSAAMRAGIEITPTLRRNIETLAAGYADATAASTKLADGQDKVRERAEEMRGIGRDVMGGFISDLIHGRDATDALTDALGRLADKALDMALDSIFSGGGLFGGGGNKDSSGGGIIGSIVGAIGSFFGFDEGGYTGAGPKHKPAGIVHAGEFVFAQDAVRKIGVDTLERLQHSALRGYANGGLVTPAPRLPAGAIAGGSQAAGNPIAINTTVNVNATGGSPEQNADLAKQVGKSVEGSVRGIVQSELRNAMRPGNMLNNGQRRLG